MTIIIILNILLDENKHTEETENAIAACESSKVKEDGEKSNVVGEEEKLQCPAKLQGSKTGEMTDHENKSIASKLYVHSQWLAVQSPYFKALFYSGMKETYTNEVVMKIYEDELQAHLTLIGAMYKLDVLNDKDYRLLVQVLVLANKYDVRLVIKKCKCVLLSTTLTLEMCEYILQEMERLSDKADIYEMLEKFLVKEFTPIDETWTMQKFTELSEAALRLLLRSDNLGSRSENTVFVALMKWVKSNLSFRVRYICDLLDLVRFEFMTIDFLVDMVQEHTIARRMPGFNTYLLNGLAYHGYSQIRREQLEPKPKKRRLVESAGPTFSWVIDDQLREKLSKFTEVSVFSNRFWYQGYAMQLQLTYAKNLKKCSFYLVIRDLIGKACLYASFKAKSKLFYANTVQIKKHVFTFSQSSWGKKCIELNPVSVVNGHTIDV
ncbi:kelch 28 isoform X2 [Paramuricea clavata]|uniref:Kelch 28 isoform X2 n=1 Tax=Paramuricea clavata TaxID=317549 RepID=A0A7D9IEW5_PARCT|nr:kelch 28 isoform X2 [Paramuricea clavata]